MTSETTTVAGTRTFVDAMLAHNKQVRAEIEQATAGLVRAGITGPVLDGLHAVAGHYDDARGRWEALGAALKQHEALAEQARATSGTATDMTFYTDDSGKDAMAASAGSTGSTSPDSIDGPDDDLLPDAAGIGSQYWHGSDVVDGDGGKVVLGVVRYTDGEQPSDAYVAVATTADPAWDPDSTASGIIPQLSPAEAGRLADEIDELAGLAEAGVPAPAPTPLAKVADRIRGLLGDSGVTVVGDQGETEVSATLIRQLLDAAAPPPAVPTRRKVTAADCDKDRMDNGTVWAELDTSGPAPVVAVTSTEGTELPEDSPGFYTTTALPPADAKVLAGKLRRFAQAAPAAAGQAPDPVEQEIRQAYQRLADRPGRYVPLAEIRDAVPTKDRARVDQALKRMLGDPAFMLEPEPFGHRIGPRERQNAVHIGGEDRHKLAIDGPAVPAGRAAAAAPAPTPAPAGPRPLRNARGEQVEYDPATGRTAVIQADGWRAQVPAGSSTGVAVWLLHTNAEIKDGRGRDVTEADARARLDRLSAGELRELADETGTSVRGARTKSQMIDAVINMMISSPRKHRGLRGGR